MSDQTNASSLTRRRFGVLAVAGAAATALSAQEVQQPNAASTRLAPGSFQRPLVPDTPAFDAPLDFTRRDVAPRVQPFPMSQVRILPNNVYFDSQEWNRGYMGRLSADRLLYTFRANAGLPVGSAKPLGGWEQPENGQRSSELRGHFSGHFLSASAQLAAMGDKEAKAKGDYMVAEMAKCQEKLGGKYLSAFPTTWWDRLEKGERVWAPFYTIHKITAGMFDMYRLAGEQTGARSARKHGGLGGRVDGFKAEAHMQQILTIEFGGIAKSFYHLAAETNNARWAKLGDRFQKKSFINPLAARRDELRGLHVNTHIPQVIAAARRYEISGDSRFRDLSEYFFMKSRPLVPMLRVGRAMRKPGSLRRGVWPLNSSRA